MEIEITPEQKAYLETWAGKRDILSSEVSNLQTQKEKLESDVRNLSDSYSDIETRANQIVGRIEELYKKEKEAQDMTFKEVVSLRIEKSSLQVEILEASKVVVDLKSKKEELQTEISFLANTLRIMNDRVGSLDKIIGDTTAINANNVAVIEGLVSAVKSGLQSVIDINTEVVKKTNSVITELPKVFLEVQRKSLERKIIKKQK